MNDASIAAVEHVPAKYLGRPQSSREVRRKDGVPVVLREVQGWRPLDAPGAVDEYVDLAEVGARLEVAVAPGKEVPS